VACSARRRLFVLRIGAALLAACMALSYFGLGSAAIGQIGRVSLQLCAHPALLGTSVANLTIGRSNPTLWALVCGATTTPFVLLALFVGYSRSRHGRIASMAMPVAVAVVFLVGCFFAVDGQTPPVFSPGKAPAVGCSSWRAGGAAIKC
jgi:hypothetical protein